MRVFIYSGDTERMSEKLILSFFEMVFKQNWTLFLMPRMITFLRAKNIHHDSIKECSHADQLQNAEIDFCLSLGGDGTVLNMLTWVRDSNIPVLGINLGRLGFLTGAEINSLEPVLKILNEKSFVIEQRSLIQLVTEDDVFGEIPFALNDFTILKRDTSSMIAVHVELDNEYLNTYWADGFIVSTPTGSTGYSLSCGGPIAFPNSGCFLLTPVAPHHLSVRPIIVNDNTVVKIRVEARTPNVLMTLDSRHVDYPSGRTITLKKCPFFINLIQMPGRTFLNNMREKLRWGSDSRIKY